MAGIRLGLVVLAPAIVLSALSGCGTTGAVQIKQIKGPAPVVPGMVDGHNRVRAKALPRPQPSLPPLVWSGPAAELARAYAAQCKFRHNSRRGAYGEVRSPVHRGRGSCRHPVVVFGGHRLRPRRQRLQEIEDLRPLHADGMA